VSKSKKSAKFTAWDTVPHGCTVTFLASRIPLHHICAKNLNIGLWQADRRHNLVQAECAMHVSCICGNKNRLYCYSFNRRFSLPLQCFFCGRPTE